MARQKVQPTYRYKHLELALARTFNVGMEDMPAFRARIRHLRNLGVPQIPNPGSGQQVSYTRAHVIQLLIALEAELLGTPPRAAAAFSKTAMTTIASKADAAAKKGEGLFLFVEPSFSFNINDFAIFVLNSDRKVPIVDEAAHRRFMVNLAMSISLLDFALGRTTGTQSLPGLGED